MPVPALLFSGRLCDVRPVPGPPAGAGPPRGRRQRLQVPPRARLSMPTVPSACRALVPQPAAGRRADSEAGGGSDGSRSSDACITATHQVGTDPPEHNCNLFAHPCLQHRALRLSLRALSHHAGVTWRRARLCLERRAPLAARLGRETAPPRRGPALPAACQCRPGRRTRAGAEARGRGGRGGVRAAVGLFP